jgi:hypothetical protein
MIRQAISTVNWSSFSRLEWNLGLYTTVRTNCRIHFPRTVVAASESSAVVSVSPAAVSSPERAPSVIKTHFRFTSAYSGYSLSCHKNKIYTFFY